MRVPFFWPALGFALGIVIAKNYALPVNAVLGCFGANIVSAWLFRGKNFFLIFFVFAMACLGFLSCRLDFHQRADAVEHHAGAGRVTLTGVVRTLPNVKTRGKRITVSLVLSARALSKWEGGAKREFEVTGNIQVSLIQPSYIPQIGDVLRISGKLEKPRRASNPGEFDYARYLAGKNIHASIQTIGGWNVQRNGCGQIAWWIRGMTLARERIAGLIDQIYPASLAAILKPLVIGIWTDVRPEIRNQFMKTGTIHLLAISGLNITMIAGSFYFLFLLLKLDFRAAALLTAFIVVIYTGLAGFGLPVLRAGAMAVLVFLGVLFGRRVHFLNTLCFAFFILLVANTRSLWDIGFQLSFLSILSLVMILPLLSRWSVKFVPLGGSWAVLAGTFPLILYYFNIFSPVSLLANLIGIPLVDAALFTSLFALLLNNIPLAGALLIHISSFFLWLALIWVKMLSAWRWGYFFFVKPSLPQMALYYSALGGILALTRWTIPWRRGILAAFFIFWLAIAGSFFFPTQRDSFRCTFLASGKNQIAHIRFENKSEWVINAGRNFPSDQGEWLVCPYLRSQGVKTLDGILLTDFSKSHAGGLPAVLRDFRLRYLLHPHSLRPLPEIFLGVLRSFRGEAREIPAGGRVLCGHEEIQVMAQHRSGMAVQISSAPWRLIIFSSIETGFLDRLKKIEDFPEIHAVILPALRPPITAAFYDWIIKVRPLLVVLPEPDTQLQKYLAVRGIACVDLKTTGALRFEKRGGFLELESFLRGKFGFYAYA